MIKSIFESIASIIDSIIGGGTTPEPPGGEQPPEQPPPAEQLPEAPEESPE
jgi:hypothetical protein